MIPLILLTIWEFIKGKMIWILLICALLLVPAAIGANKVQSSMEISTNMEKSADTYINIKKLEKEFYTQTIVVLLEGEGVEQIVSEQNLAAMKSFDEALTGRDHVLFVMTPEFFVDAMIQYGMLEPDASPVPSIIDNESENGISSTFDSVFFNQQNGFMAVGLTGGEVGEVSQDEMHDIIADIKTAVDQAGFDSNVTPVITGYPVLTSFLAKEMPRTLNKLMGIVIVVMLVVLLITFRPRGLFIRRWLSLLMVFVSVLFTMGIMGFLDIPLTTTSLVVYPILLGMGVDSAIQFHNRYDEESRKGKMADESAKSTLTRVGTPLIIAMVACAAGFASVFLTKAPAMKYFGFNLVLGVALSVVVSLSLLLGILYLLDKRSDATRKAAPRGIQPLDKVMTHMVPRLVKFAPVIIIIALIGASVGWYLEKDVDPKVGITGIAKGDRQELVDLKHLQELAGGVSPLNVLVEADDVLKPEVMNWAYDRAEELMDKQGIDKGGYVGEVNSLPHLFIQLFDEIPASSEEARNLLGLLPDRMWIPLVNAEFDILNVQITNQKDTNEEITQTTEAMTEIFASPPEGVVAIPTGLAYLGPEIADNINSSRTRMLIFGVGFIILAMLVMFKFNVKRVFAVTFPIILVLGWAGLVLQLVGVKISPTMALLPAQVMAIGVEFTLLMMMRYYEERDKGEGPMEAMITAMRRIGRAILVSSTMVILGFGVMLFAFEFPGMQEFGLVTVIQTILVLASTLVLLPALVVSFDLKRGKAKTQNPV